MIINGWRIYDVDTDVYYDYMSYTRIAYKYATLLVYLPEIRRKPCVINNLTNVTVIDFINIIHKTLDRKKLVFFFQKHSYSLGDNRNINIGRKTSLGHYVIY